MKNANLADALLASGVEKFKEGVGWRVDLKPGKPGFAFLVIFSHFGPFLRAFCELFLF